MKNANALKNAPPLRFRLFIAGGEVNSVQARKNLHELCANLLPLKCEITEIDVLKDASQALHEGILVTPTLSIEGGADAPRVLVYGNLSDKGRLRGILGIPEKERRE